MDSLFQWPPTDVAIAKLGLYLVTLFGTVATYVFQLHKGFEGATSFLRRVLPKHSDAFYARVDFVIVAITGSCFGLIIFSPQNAFQALAAGCGWVSALNVMMTGKGSPGGTVNPPNGPALGDKDK